MGGAQQPESVRLGGAAAGIRHDVIDLQQVLGAAAAPVASQPSRLTAAGMARPVTPVFAAEVRVRGKPPPWAQDDRDLHDDRELRPKEDYPWFWHGDRFTGDRVNDVHLTNAEKSKPRREMLRWNGRPARGC